MTRALSRDEWQALRSLRDGKAAEPLSKQQRLSLSRTRLIRGSLRASVLTVVGLERANQPDRVRAKRRLVDAGG
jgi:hypothetical protein